MSGHTPGPWAASLGRFAFTNSGQRAVTTIANDHEDSIHIAYVSTIADRKRNTPYDAPDPEREANARLIAAAPTQHAELVRYLPIIERAEADAELWARLTKGTGIATANGYRAAIAAATGETS